MHKIRLFEKILRKKGWTVRNHVVFVGALGEDPSVPEYDELNDTFLPWWGKFLKREAVHRVV